MDFNHKLVPLKRSHPDVYQMLLKLGKEILSKQCHLCQNKLNRVMENILNQTEKNMHVTKTEESLLDTAAWYYVNDDFICERCFLDKTEKIPELRENVYGEIQKGL